MTSRWRSGLRISIIALVALAIASPVRVQARSVTPVLFASPVGDGELLNCQDTAAPHAAASRDRVYLRQEPRSIVVEVYRVSGIGSTQLHRPASGWPEVVSVRMHHFPFLEGFSARSPAGKMTCEQSRPEGPPARLDCLLAGARIDAIKRETDYFEVSLPQALLEGGGPVEIHWIDQWR